MDEDFEDDDAFEETETGALDSASTLFRPLEERERELLDKLSAYADRYAGGRPDAKAKAFLTWLQDQLLAPEVAGEQRRVIVFTEYRATQT